MLTGIAMSREAAFDGRPQHVLALTTAWPVSTCGWWPRMRRAGIRLSQVEVRFEDLSIETDVAVGSRALPSVQNSLIDLAAV